MSFKFQYHNIPLLTLLREMLGDILDIAVHKNIGLSDVIVSEILDSDHLPIVFHLLDLVRTRNLSDPVDKLTDWGRFQRLASELISPKFRINSGKAANKAAHNFTASIALAYRLSANKLTLKDLNKDLRGLESLLKHKQMLRKRVKPRPSKHLSQSTPYSSRSR
jgi:hypothetical protein